MKHEVDVIAIKTPSCDGVIEVSTALLEDYFDVSRKTVNEWAKKGCAKLSYGKWDLINVLKWRGGLQAINDESEEDDKDVYLRKVKADAFLKEKQGQIAEIQLQKLRNEVVDIDFVEQLIGGVISNTKGLLQALPSKAAPKLLGLSMLSDLRDALMDRMEDFCKTKTPKDVSAVIDEALVDFCEAKSLVEINEVLTMLIYEALEELASVDIEMLKGDIDEAADEESINEISGTLETSGTDQSVGVGG